MVFTHTSRSKRSAFTILEYLVATSIGVIVLAAALVLWGYASRTCAMLYGYVELSSMSKIALDKVSQKIRNARKVQSCTANQLILVCPSEVTTNTVQVRITYASGNLTMTSFETGIGTSTKTLLTGCSNFVFDVYQRTPQTNSFNLTTNGYTPLTAKVIQMRWKCARSLRGDKNIIENQVAANVVIRSK